MIRSGGSGDVRIPGERVLDQDDVVAGGGEGSPALHRERDVRERLTVLQRQRADVDQAETAVLGRKVDVSPFGARRQDATASTTTVEVRVWVIMSFWAGGGWSGRIYARQLMITTLMVTTSLYRLAARPVRRTARSSPGAPHPDRRVADQQAGARCWYS